MFEAIISRARCTSVAVPQQVSVDVVDVGVDGGAAGHAARGHVGVGLGVNVLQALPGDSRAELCEKGGAQTSREEELWLLLLPAVFSFLHSNQYFH